MQKLFLNNFGLKSIIFYLAICVVVVGMSVFVLQNHQLIVANDLSKVSVKYQFYNALMISFLILVTTFFVTPFFFTAYLRKENVSYSITKLLPYFPIISTFCFFLVLFRPQYDGINEGTNLSFTQHMYAIFFGLGFLIAAVCILHFVEYFQTTFKKAMIFAYNKSYTNGGGKLSLHDFENAIDKGERDPVFLEDPNEELIKRVEKLVNSTEELEVEPIGDINLNIVIYVYGDGFDYCLLDSGLDIPFMFGDEDPNLVLAECHFLHINKALYFRIDQVYVFNFDENYVILNPAVDRNLHHIRSKRVKEKLNSYRIPERPSGYFSIHPDLANNLRIVLDKYAK